MDEKPHGREERLLTNRILKNIFFQAVYQVGVLLLVLYWGDTIWNVEEKSVRHYTIIFNSFVFCQVFNEINSRTVIDEINVFKGFFTNFIFIFVIIVTCVLQFIIIQFTGKVFKVEPLDWSEWLSSVAIGAFSLVLGFLVRFIPVPERHFIEIFFFCNRKNSKVSNSYDFDVEDESNVKKPLIKSTKNDYNTF